MEKPKTRRTAAEQKAAFNHVRLAHQTEVAEDYVELVDDLIEEKGEARAVDLAERLGVSAATVNKTVKRLQREGYLNAEPYRSIFLTDQGKAMADASRERHELVYSFLIAIGVSEETATIDAEGVEHHVSEETLLQFKKMISKLSRG
ncbi:MAG: manganese-binding transcriptional regulator MntR [Granulosicoccaceae bacterium]